MKNYYRSLLPYKFVWIALLCAMMLLFLSAASTQAAPASACGGQHLVQQGETLYSISVQYGVSVQALMQANPYIHNPNRIYAGTWIYIPCGSPPPSGPPPVHGSCRYVHYVAWGQTLNQIALHYMVNPQLIMHANGISNPNLIYAGTGLCIP